jgi:hypothetical protein
VPPPRPERPSRACAASVPLPGEPADSDHRRPCETPADRILTWSDGDELAYCGVHAGRHIEASSVRQTLHAVVASAPVDQPRQLTIHRPDLWRFVLRRPLPDA